MIEVSYSNKRSNDLLFGHLKPSLLLQELDQLAQITNQNNPKSALKGLNIVITHIKQNFKPICSQEKILNELQKNNQLGVHFILPTQGKILTF